MKNDITVEILKDIRTGIRETNARIDQTNAELGNLRTEVREDMGSLREELSRRIVESEVRKATAMTELGGSVREVVTLLRSQHDLRPRVERCESEIADLKKRSRA